MTFTGRLVLAIVILAAFSGLIMLLSQGDPEQNGSDRAVRWESSQQCKQCHEGVYAEWFSSHHRIAYTNPEVKKLSEDYRKEECLDCHLPRPLAITGIGNRTLPRRTHFDEGVSCISCHLAPDGGILARNDRPEVPCAPQRSADFVAVKLCESCHNQHWTTDQWRASIYAKQGTDCSSCHMPEVERVRADGSRRMGRGHVYPGAHDKETLRAAGEFVVRREGDEVVLSLTNVGAGHNFPTEERHRAVDMMVRFVAADGATGEWTLLYRFRQPYRDDTEPVGPGAEVQENTQLPAKATKTARAAIPDGTVAVEARLWYRLTPYVGDDSPQSTLLEERRIDL